MYEGLKQKFNECFNLGAEYLFSAPGHLSSAATTPTISWAECWREL